jgi:predicted enzyme related to lactoylglutathione lyase
MHENTPPVGTIIWRDLTVNDAEAIRDFYARVVRWTAQPVTMGSYQDFNMVPPETREPEAGICHARGENADLPPQWLIYIVVDDIDRSLEDCVRLGGAIVAPPRGMMGGRFCVIRDPAGAVCGLYQPPSAA